MEFRASRSLLPEGQTLKTDTFSGQALWTDTFVRRNGKWLCVATQSSEIAPAKK